MSSPDVIARKLVIDLELWLNNKVFSGPWGSGYDVLVKFNGDEKHIEAKGIKNNDAFFAVNGLDGVRELLFDSKYYIYFCDVENDAILVTDNKFIHRAMKWSTDVQANRLINSWLELGYSIRSILKVTVDGRIRFHISPPIRTIIASLQNGDSALDIDLVQTIVALWKRQENVWDKIYPDEKNTQEEITRKVRRMTVKKITPEKRVLQGIVKKVKQAKYPVANRGPSYQNYLTRLREKRRLAKENKIDVFQNYGLKEKQHL